MQGNKALEAAKNKVAAKSEQTEKPKTFQQLVTAMKSQIAMAVPKHLTPERVMRIALTAYSSNPKLQECDSMSILAAVMQSAQCGLEPNTVLGEAYIIPYNDFKNNRSMAQFQIGYKGILKLAYNSQQYKQIGAYEVYSNDDFKYSYGLDQQLHHVPAEDPEGEPVYYYAFYKLHNGGEGFAVMSRKQVENHAKKYTKQQKNGKLVNVWEKEFDEMAKKTVLLKALKYAPKSTEIANAMMNEGSIKTEIKEDMNEASNLIFENGETIDVNTGEVLS